MPTSHPTCTSTCIHQTQKKTVTIIEWFHHTNYIIYVIDIFISTFEGCSKCLKSFPRVINEDGSTSLKANYSGYAKQEWPARESIVHRLFATRAKAANCATSRTEIEKEYGARWSVLYELPYFNPVQHHSVDPMHCMYLGIAKRFTKLLYDKGYLTNEDTISIQNIVNTVKVPSNITRIPRKIGSNFTGLTADQWKNWTQIYSSIALKDKLPEDIYKIWMLFVKAANLIGKRTIKQSDLDVAEKLILKFASAYEQKFGEQECTPNLHMFCHLVDVIKDLGPVYAFWCYSFER